jgi:hypothetical protein
MRRKAVLWYLMAVLAITVGSQVSELQSRAQIARPLDSPFDRPLRKEVIDLGPSEFYEPRFKVRNTLTCFYYPRFVVKQLDFGQKGAEWDAIVPTGGGNWPRCEQTKNDREIRVDQEHWCGYFAGAVGNLVFLDASDGLNGSMNFSVIETESGREVFRDTARRKYLIKKNRLVWEGQRLQIKKHPEGPPVLTYTRAYFAECPLPKGGLDCWNKIRASTGLNQPTAPVCRQQFKEDPDDFSVIFYPVRVQLGPKPEPIPMPGRILCQDQE